jgi:hypothetical protein
MQQRKGTAAQWTAANPILNAGEIGWESDTNKFKIGDGTNHWADLDYFADINSTVNPAFGTSITFEGATADSYETTLQVTDPTADRTITLPNVSGTVITTGNLSDITDIGVFTGSITIEGTTADGFETTLAVTDPTADRTITFPDATGTVALAANVAALSGAAFTGAITGTSLSLSGDLTVQGTTTTIDSTTIQLKNSLVFEGATADSYETTVQITDPTQDNTITLQNASGVIPLRDTSDTFTNKSISLTTNTITGTKAEFNSAMSDADFATLAGTETLTNKTLTSPTVSGLTLSDGSFVMEGATADDFELTISAGNPTADRTVTFQDVSGTVALTADFTGYVTETGTQTLSNKSISLGSNTVTSTLAQLNTAISDADVASRAGTETLTNKTLTSPKINEDVVMSATATELNVLDGITSSTAELNILDGVTSSAAELNILDGATLSVTELNYVDGVTSAIQTQLDAKLALAGGTMTGAIAMGTNKITGLGTPTADADAATKAYVDAVQQGLHIHASVVAATTANITLATDVENGDVLDGVTLATGDRILVKNQSTASQNGIYVVASSGAPSRATDFDSPIEIDGGDFVFVTGGTANDNKGFVQINTVGTVGTDAIEFSQFSGAGIFVAGNGLTLTDNSFSINTSITADLSTAQTLTNKTLTSAKINLGINAQTGTTYTFVLADDGKFVTASNANPITVTIPPISSHAYPIGAQLNIVQKGAGQVTFAQGAGVTIRSTGTTASAPKLRVQYSSATAVHEGSDIWYVVGDIS